MASRPFLLLALMVQKCISSYYLLIWKQPFHFQQRLHILFWEVLLLVRFLQPNAALVNLLTLGILICNCGHQGCWSGCGGKKIENHCANLITGDSNVNVPGLGLTEVVVVLSNCLLGGWKNVLFYFLKDHLSITGDLKDLLAMPAQLIKFFKLFKFLAEKWACKMDLKTVVFLFFTLLAIGLKKKQFCVITNVFLKFSLHAGGFSASWQCHGSSMLESLHSCLCQAYD